MTTKAREREMAEGLKVDTQQSPGNGRGTCADRADRPASLWSRFGQSHVVRAIASTMMAIGAPGMRRRRPQAEPGPQAITAPESLAAGTDVPNARHVALACPPPTPASRERHPSTWRMPNAGRVLASILKSTRACLRNTTHGASSPARSARVAGLALLVLMAASGTMAVQAEELVSNIDQGETFDGSTRKAYSQPFTTGSHDHGWTLTSVQIQAGDSVSFSISLYTVNASGLPDDEITELTPPSSFSSGLLTFTAPEQTYLLPNTTYTFRTASTSSHQLKLTNSDNEDTGGATGWSIRNNHHILNNSDRWVSAGSGSMRIAINGEVATNTPATGSISISGTARVGETLTGMANNLADLNGLPENSTDYSLQWVRIDGTTQTPISGATSNSYTLVAADADKRVKFRVSFTDGLGFAETIESAEIAIRAMMPPATCPTYSTPTGQTQVWNGTVTVAAIRCSMSRQRGGDRQQDRTRDRRWRLATAIVNTILGNI